MKVIRSFLVVLALVLAGCDQQGKQRQHVSEKFPDSLIHDMPTASNNSYLVRKPDGSVWIVNCNNGFDFDVSSESMLFPPNR